MTPNSRAKFEELFNCLNQLVSVYRRLLGVVRKERDIIVSADLDDLNENNKAKEAMLVKIHELENSRIQLVEQFIKLERIQTENPSLIDIATHLGGEYEEKLTNIHSVLTLMLKRVKTYNVENETLVTTALENITGAMKAIKETLQEKPTYQSKGDMKDPAVPGQLVSREA